MSSLWTTDGERPVARKPAESTTSSGAASAPIDPADTDPGADRCKRAAAASGWTSTR